MPSRGACAQVEWRYWPVTDFFISYKSDSVAWATWVAATLEDRGYTTRLQTRDFLVGSNIITNIDDALKECDRMIALLSPGYLEASAFTRAEWAAKLMESPDGELKRLLPFIVEPCEPTGLLKPIVYQSLVGLSERC